MLQRYSQKCTERYCIIFWIKSQRLVLKSVLYKFFFTYLNICIWFWNKKDLKWMILTEEKNLVVKEKYLESFNCTKYFLHILLFYNILIIFWEKKLAFFGSGGGGSTQLPPPLTDSSAKHSSFFVRASLYDSWEGWSSLISYKRIICFWWTIHRGQLSLLLQ